MPAGILPVTENNQPGQAGPGVMVSRLGMRRPRLLGNHYPAILRRYGPAWSPVTNWFDVADGCHVDGRLSGFDLASRCPVSPQPHPIFPARLYPLW